jgi:hypothetical protein
VAFAVFGKVLSPQYLLWILPFAATIPEASGRPVRVLFLASAVVTLWLFPWTFGALWGLKPWAFAILNLRNGMLVALWALLTFAPTEPVLADASDCRADEISEHLQPKCQRGLCKRMRVAASPAEAA